MSEFRYFKDDMCGYKPTPTNYNNWLSSLHAERLKRLGRGSSALKLHMDKRPMIIMLHLFADDVNGLRHWVNMIYEMAAPDAYGHKIEFFVDDLWAAYVFERNGFSIWRGHTSFSIKSPPMIFGVSASGKVHFFGTASGPKAPCLKTLHEFCDQLLAETLVEQCGFKDRANVPDVDLYNFNELIYGEQEDVIICFYNSNELGIGETGEFLDDLYRLAAKLQQEQIKIFKMDVRKSFPPKKFAIKTVPSMFLLPKDQKQNPIRCHFPCNGIGAMLKHVAQHSSKELYFYDRHGLRNLHADLFQHIQSFFKEDNYYLFGAL